MPPKTKRKQAKAPTTKKKTTKKDTKEEAKKPEVKWQHSEAKEMLKFDLVSRVVTAEMTPKEVYAMRAEYRVYNYVNFRTNLRNLREAVEKNRQRMLDDCVFFGHDLDVLARMRETDPLPEPAYPLWHKSKAKKLLEVNVKEGAHIGITPSYLWIQRPEYLEFPLHVFRKHIHQQVTKMDALEFRFAKKKFRFQYNNRHESENIQHDGDNVEDDNK